MQGIACRFSQASADRVWGIKCLVVFTRFMLYVGMEVNYLRRAYPQKYRKTKKVARLLLFRRENVKSLVATC